MEPSDQSVKALTGQREGRPRDLSRKWFIESQAPLILHHGIFPSWFQGFITRKDAEKVLCYKEQGCFLIRLSDKATGYILSYKGSSRCRHFIISQSNTGQLIVSGDIQAHDTLLEVIQYYKTNPIEPFGEYLTYSCFEECSEELYDMIQDGHNEKPPVSMGAGMPSSLPHQSPSKQEETSHLPKRGGPRPDEESKASGDDMCASQGNTDTNRHKSDGSSPQGSRGMAEWLEAERFLQKNNHRDDLTPGPGTVSSELNLLEGKSTSLPLLDISSEGDRSYRRDQTFETPKLSPHSASWVRVGGAAASQQPMKTCSSRANSSHSLDDLYDPVYYLAGGAKPESHTYEALEEVRPKHKVSSSSVTNDKRKWFPEHKRK